MEYKILVLLKPNDEVQPAVERASDFARFMPDIEVTICRIINDFDENNKAALESKASRDLLALAQSHPSFKHFVPRIIFSKNVPEAFINESHQGNYSLAIISANKRNTIRDLFVSSIDYTIMRKIDTPLLVVKAADAPQRLGRAILLAIDFEEDDHDEVQDEMLFRAAKVFAEEFNGELHVANCVPPYHRGLISGNPQMPKSFSHEQLSRPALHRKLLDEYAAKHDIPTERTHVLIGRVDEEIPRLCIKLDARMVCIGASPTGGLLGSINGTASELVLEQIKGDLFLVNDRLPNVPEE